MSIENLVVRGVSFAVTKAPDGRLLDVRAILTPEQQTTLYQQFDLKSYDMKTCSSLFTVVTELAKIEVELSRAAKKKGAEKDKAIKDQIDELRKKLLVLVEFEALINHPHPTVHTLIALRDLLEPFLGGSNKDSVFKFYQTLTHLINKNPSTEELQAVFAATDLNSDIMSLGRFIAEYTSELITQTQKEIYSIRDSRFRDLFMMHPALKALSDAKSNIERVRLSLSGTRHVNTRTPIPTSMLDYTRLGLQVVNPGTQAFFDWVLDDASMPGAGAGAGARTSGDDGGALRNSISLMPYLKQDDMDIDRILTIANAVGSENRRFKYKKPTAWWAVPLILGTLVEFAGTVVLRVPLTVMSLGASLMGRAFNLIGLGWTTKYFDALLSQAHAFISPVRAIKNAKSRGYTTEHKEAKRLKTALQNQGRSFFSMLMDNVSGDAVADKVANSARTFVSEITYAKPLELVTLFRTKAARAKKLANIQQDFNQHISALPPQATVDASMGGASSGGGSFSSVPLSVGSVASSQTSVACLAPPTPWSSSDFHSPTGFFVQIAEGLSDTVIDSMFRKSPGAATLYFAVAMASFGSLMAPGLVTQLFHARIEYFLKLLPNWMSQHFTGVPAETSLEKVVGVFLQWKVLFFGTELALNTAQGDFSLLKDLFSNPEKILMAMVTLIALGYSLAYIPKIDSPFAAALNFFSNEARKCMNADIGLNGLEYAFLGLKFTLLCSSMVSGKHAPEGREAFDYPALLAELHDQDVMNSADDQTTLRAIVQRYTMDLTEAEQEEIVRSLKDCIQSLRVERRDLTVFTQYFPWPLFCRVNPMMGAGMGATSAAAGTTVAPSHAALADLVQDRLVRNLTTAQLMETSGYQFHSKRDAATFYDELHQSYRKYNQRCKADGRLDLVVQRDNVLHAFYNKHCYKGSNHLLRLVSLLAFPVTALWRGFKYGIASTETFRSAAVREQVLKSFAKDRAIVFEGVASLFRVGRAFTRAMTYAFLRAPLVLIAIPVLVMSTLISFIPVCAKAGCVCRDFVHRFVGAIRPHAAQLPTLVARVPYAKAMRKADVSHDGLVPSTTRAILDTISTATTAQTWPLDTAIGAARGRIGFFNSDKKKEGLQRVSSVFRDPGLGQPEMATKIHSIVAEDKFLEQELTLAVDAEFPPSDFEIAIRAARSHIGFFNSDKKKADLQRLFSIFHHQLLDQDQKAQQIRAIVAEDKFLKQELTRAVDAAFPPPVAPRA